MRKFRVFALICISALLITTSVNVSRSCGPFLDVVRDVSQFFDPTLIKTTSGVTLAEWEHRRHAEVCESLQIIDNVNEWRAFCDLVPSLDHIAMVVYDATPEQLHQIKHFISHGVSLTGLYLSGRSFAKPHSGAVMSADLNSLVAYWKT